MSDPPGAVNTPVGARTPTSPRSLAIALAALTVLAVGLFAISPAPVGVFWDDAVYVITGKALATGQGYRYIHLPGTPSASHYPPLWPLLLSIVWRVAPDFPANVHIMKLLNPVLLAAAAALTTILALRSARSNLWICACAAAAACVVAPLLMLSSVLMSEPLCLALSAAALGTSTRAVMHGRPRDGAIAGALAGLAILSRSAAIILLPALAVGVLWRRSRRASAIAVAVALVLIVPWFVWSGAHAHELPPVLSGSYGPYTSWVIGAYRSNPALLVDVVRVNLASAYHDAGVVLFSAMPIWSRPYLLAPLLMLVTVGLVLARRRGATLAMTLLAYTTLFIVWPYTPGRFMWAFAPLYAAGAIVAVSAILRQARRTRFARPARFAVAGLALLTLANVLRYDIVGTARGWHRAAVEHNADGTVDAVGWIQRYTAMTDTIATDVHLMAYLYTGRIALPINSLTVEEHVRPKSLAQMRQEFANIDSTFHPKWWVVTGMVPEREALRAWGIEPMSVLRPAAELPGGGLVGREIRQ